MTCIVGFELSNDKVLLAGDTLLTDRGHGALPTESKVFGFRGWGRVGMGSCGDHVGVLIVRLVISAPIDVLELELR